MTLTLACHTGEPGRGHSVLLSHLVSDNVQRVIIHTRTQDRPGHGVQEHISINDDDDGSDSDDDDDKDHSYDHDDDDDDDDNDNGYCPW